MTYNEYRRFALTRQVQIMMVSDCNTIVDKLTFWQNRGKENPIWQTAPTISTGADSDDILFDNVPYVIGLSEYTSDLLYELTKDQKKGEHGGYECPIRLVDDVILPTLSITTQFGILEYYEIESYRVALQNGKLFDIDTDKFSLKDINSRGIDVMIAGRVKALTDNYSLKSVAKRVSSCWKAIGIESLNDKDTKLYVQLADRRNELTHELKCTPPTIEEAKQYFEDCNTIAIRIRDSFANVLNK